MSTSKDDLPLGTTPDTERLHTRIRRICYVLLFGLVLEGAFVTPFALIWYGWPELSVKQVCSGLEQVMYSDKKLQCQSYSLTSAPPFGPVPKDIQHLASNDTWGPIPTPNYKRIGFRQLVKQERQDHDAAASAATRSTCATTADTGSHGAGVPSSKPRCSPARSGEQ